MCIRDSDTGVLLAHPDLQGRLVSGYDFISDSILALDGDGIDDDPDDPGDRSPGGSSFHGTHVAGTIAAATNNGTSGVAGVTWATGIMPLRALGRGGAGTSYDILQAVRYAAGLENDSDTTPERPADVINLSLGGSASSQSEQDVFTAARSAGVVIVAAAGNESSSQASYPAAYDGVISVSAVDINSSLAPYSNFGSTVDVAAPGGNTAKDLNGDGYPDGVLSTAGDDSAGSINFVYKFYQGTSMATPHMAGVAALMKAVYPSLTPAQLDNLLATGSITKDIGDAGRDDSFGYGLIDAGKAVNAASELSSGGAAAGATLVINPASLNFGDTLDTITLTVENGGTESLSLLSVAADENWLTLDAADVDADGLGSYSATVDRSVLDSGTYSATLTFISTANTVTVAVIMQVAEAVLNGDAGFHYILLLDQDSYETVSQVEVAADGGAYGYSFSGIEAGTYVIFAGTDLDNDFVVGDSGEASGAYISLDQPTPLTVGSDLSELDFSTGFNVNLPSQATAEAGNGLGPFQRLDQAEESGTTDGWRQIIFEQ